MITKSFSSSAVCAALTDSVERLFLSETLLDSKSSFNVFLRYHGLGFDMLNNIPQAQTTKKNAEAK